MPLAPEVDLLTHCCRWPVDRATVERRLESGGDSARFVTLARRHRVQGLVNHALQGVAGARAAHIRSVLRDEARGIAVDNLRLAVESDRLVRALTVAGAPSLVLKGVTVAKLAYGSLGLKLGWDIDLLIAPDALRAGAEVLAEQGYGLVLPEPNAVDLAAWHAYSKESVWRHKDTGVHVELHTALVDHPRLLEGVGVDSPVQQVPVGGGVCLPTLSDEDLLAYLSVHGAASGWRRLKWLADFAALAGKLDAAKIDAWYRSSAARRAGRAVGQALLLSERYLGLGLPPQLLREIRRDPATRLVARMAGRMMTRRDAFDAPEETAFGTLPVHVSYAMMAPGWPAMLAEARRKLGARDPRGGNGLSSILAGRLRRLVRVRAGA